MSMPGATPGIFILPADLVPADTYQAKADLLDRLAKATDQIVVELEAGPGPVSTSSLQLIIAATRSGAANPPTLGQRAADAVKSSLLPTFLERATQCQKPS